MGGVVISPLPAPSPVKGEGRCRMTDVTQYLPLSAPSTGEDRGGGDQGENAAHGTPHRSPGMALHATNKS
jgi:hypothetical protein